MANVNFSKVSLTNGDTGIVHDDGATAYCATAAGTKAKTATMDSYRLVTGARFRLYLETANTVAGATLDVNSTGAKTVYANGAATTSGNLTAGWWDALYDGTYYQLRNTGTQTTPVKAGGTGMTSSPSMLTNLASTSASNVLQSSPRPGVTGTLGISNGGTGATTAAAARENLSVFPDYAFETVAAMTEAISSGQVPDGAVCYVTGGVTSGTSS